MDITTIFVVSCALIFIISVLNESPLLFFGYIAVASLGLALAMFTTMFSALGTALLYIAIAILIIITIKNIYDLIYVVTRRESDVD